MQKTIKDLVVSSSPVHIRNYLGKIVVTYSARDEEKCAPIFERLANEHFAFIRNPLMQTGNMPPYYMENVRRMTDECACFIIAVSENLFSSDENKAANDLWYQVGQVGAKNAESIKEFIRENRENGKVTDSPVFLPVMLDGNKSSLAGTPLQDLNVARNADEMAATLSKKHFASKLMKDNFYDNSHIGQFAGQRISYGSEKVAFEITEKSFRNVQEIILKTQQVNISDGELDTLIRKSILGKVRLIGFGSREKMEPQFRIYEDEIDISVKDFPENFIGAKSYIVNKPDEIKHSGIRAVLTVEFIIPIHTLLGVYFKPYITVADDASDRYDFNTEEMLEILRPTFTLSKSAEWYKNTEFDTFFDGENRRLYFNFTNDKEKRLKLSPDENAGEYADYLYPQ